MALEVTIVLRDFGSKRVFLYPEGCTYLCIGQAMYEMFSWDFDPPHRFVIGDRIIADGKDGSEDEINTVVEGPINGGTFEYSDFVIFFDVKKTDKVIEKPVITVSEGLFPGPDFTAEEWCRVLMGQDIDPKDLEEIKSLQDYKGINDFFEKFWLPIPVLKGRICPVSGQIIGQALMMGISGLWYNVQFDKVINRFGPTCPDDILISSEDSDILMVAVEKFAKTHRIKDPDPLSAIIKNFFEEWMEFILPQSQSILSEWAYSKMLYADQYFTEDQVEDIIAQVEGFFRSTVVAEEQLEKD